MKRFPQQPTPVPAQVELPQNFPEIPAEIIDRFGDSARDWQKRLDEFWTRSNQAIQQAQNQTAGQVNSKVVFNVDSFLIYAKGGIAQPMFSLDGTGVRLGDVLVVNTPGRKVYIGQGDYADDGTPFYIDTLGKFSLGSKLTWEPSTAVLTITGTIIATGGTIGGFDIGVDYIRDTNNSFGLSSASTFFDDVRFWAGATFANRATAPFRITEAGVITATSGTLGGFTLTSTSLSAGSGANRVELSSAAAPFLSFGIYASTLFNFLGANGTVLFDSSGSALYLLNGGAGYGVLTLYDTGVEKLRLGGDGYIIFTSDTNLYRSAANTLKTDDAFIAAGGINSTAIGATTPSTGAFTSLSATINNVRATFVSESASSTAGTYIKAKNGAGTDYGVSTTRIVGSSGDLEIYTGATVAGEALRLTLNSTGLTIAGSIKTAAPTTGAAGAWKLGQYTAGVAVQAGKIRLNVDGTDYDLLTA